MIEVTYDGEYPNTCSGLLTIKENDIIVYKKCNCCTSTGNVSFDENWNECVNSGELIWDDADKFSKEIQLAVNDILSNCNVCCGGCI
jgi:hypothetical protein